MVLAADADADGLRLAFAVGRKVGGAVVRNRIRRRLRAAVHELGRTGAGLPTGACLVIVRPAAAAATYDDLRVALRQAMTRAAERADKRVT